MVRTLRGYIMNNFVLSAIARGEEGQALLAFARDNHLQADWNDPHSVGVHAMLSGNTLDNTSGSKYINDDGTENREYIVHLYSDRSGCLINLATVLAMASAYVESQLARAEHTISSHQT